MTTSGEPGHPLAAIAEFAARAERETEVANELTTLLTEYRERFSHEVLGGPLATWEQMGVRLDAEEPVTLNYDHGSTVSMVSLKWGFLGQHPVGKSTVETATDVEVAAPASNIGRYVEFVSAINVVLQRKQNLVPVNSATPILGVKPIEQPGRRKRDPASYAISRFEVLSALKTYVMGNPEAYMTAASTLSIYSPIKVKPNKITTGRLERSQIIHPPNSLSYISGHLINNCLYRSDKEGNTVEVIAREIFELCFQTEKEKFENSLEPEYQMLGQILGILENSTAMTLT